jgi:hypothetical protein
VPPHRFAYTSSAFESKYNETPHYEISSALLSSATLLLLSALLPYNDNNPDIILFKLAVSMYAFLSIIFIMEIKAMIIGNGLEFVSYGSEEFGFKVTRSGALCVDDEFTHAAPRCI